MTTARAGSDRTTAGGSAAAAPEPHDDELAARLRVAVTRLNRRLRQQSLAGLSPAQASALGSINRLGTPTLGELAVAEQVQPPTMTRSGRPRWRRPVWWPAWATPSDRPGLPGAADRRGAADPGADPHP